MAATELEEGRMHKVTRTLAKKALAPVAASAAAYAARKLPQLFEEKIAPKLRERGGARAAAQDVVGTVGSRVQHAKEAVASKVGDVPLPSGGTGDRAERYGGDTTNGGPSDQEREEARRKREQNRQARRKAST